MNHLLAPCTSGALRVLVVEDDALIAQDLANLLGDWGYSVAGCADSTREAVELFRQNPPDLALVDVQLLDGGDGIDAVRAFNEIRRVPIVYLTAQADGPTVARAKSTAPAAYLLKPFDERHLQISLDLAFSNFTKTPENAPFEAEKAPFTHEIKLSGELILRKGDEVFIKQNYRFVKICLADIHCLEADRTHTFLFAKDKKLILRLPLAAVLERLGDDRFVRVHRSFAVNAEAVESFDEREIIVQGRVVPFSATFRPAFFKNFNIV